MKTIKIAMDIECSDEDVVDKIADKLHEDYGVKDDVIYDGTTLSVFETEISVQNKATEEQICQQFNTDIRSCGGCGEVDISIVIIPPRTSHKFSE